MATINETDPEPLLKQANWGSGSAEGQGGGGGGTPASTSAQVDSAILAAGQAAQNQAPRPVGRPLPLPLLPQPGATAHPFSTVLQQLLGGNTQMQQQAMAPGGGSTGVPTPPTTSLGAPGPSNAPTTSPLMTWLQTLLRPNEPTSPVQQQRAK
jgi:hypothetical protein